MKKLLHALFLAATLLGFSSFSTVFAADFPAAKLNFELGKADLPAEAAAAVAAAAEFVKANQDANTVRGDNEQYRKKKGPKPFS